jgi:membrane protease YdiL (CAAX protease family)
MWVPGIAAILTSLYTRRSFKLIGWKLPVKWMALGWITPVFYAFIAYGLIWIFGLGDVPNPIFLERARFTLGMSSGSDSLIIVSAFFYITVVNLIPALVMSLGEEIGWRGFLVPELSEWVGFRKASWMSGLIWAAWHLPDILLGKYASAGTPLIYQIFCFSLMVVSTGVMLAWLRMKSNSIWAVAIFHATHNGVIQMFFDRITIDTGSTGYYSGEFGIALVPVTILLAWYFYNRPGEIQKKHTPMIIHKSESWLKK